MNISLPYITMKFYILIRLHMFQDNSV